MIRPDFLPLVFSFRVYVFFIGGLGSMGTDTFFCRFYTTNCILYSTSVVGVLVVLGMWWGESG